MAIEVAVAVGDSAPLLLKTPEEPWSERFARCAELIRGVLGGYAVRVDHIGSTAVPGLIGRPHLDIQVSVAEPEAEEDYRGALEGLGFRLRLREADRRVFTGEEGAIPAPASSCETHVYVCRSGGVVEYDQLLVVDYLATHAERRERYAELKRRLAPGSRGSPAYEQAKGLFLRETVRLAHRAYVDFNSLSDLG
jgi:GrpB-like predicted nucleotidyltransferase (UPF0157 family)